MSFADKLTEAVHQVLREYNLTNLELEDEIIIPNLEDSVPIELVIAPDPENADLLSGPKSVGLLIDLQSIIATGEPITVETFKWQIVNQLERLGLIPKHIIITGIARPFVSEDGETVIIGTHDVSGEVTVLQLSKSGVEFLVSELQKLLT